MFNVNENLLNKVGTNGYVYEVTLKQLLASGYLAVPKYIPVDTKIDGEIEYNISDEDMQYFISHKELSARLERQIANSSLRNKVIVEQYLKNKDIYGKTLIFAVNQMHAETLCDEFKKAGVSCDYAVSGRSDAQNVIADFKNNKFDVLINVQILTEGSDVPDIQTVFLTRETNSDSLLMQMIGRGLRGEKAGGTKEAYIVSFHDTWSKFIYWLDPGALEIFESETESVSEEREELPPIEPDEKMLTFLEQLRTKGAENEETIDVVPEEIEEPADITRDIYMKLYQMMRASLTVENELPVYPCGWYSVIDENGNDKKVLVFDCQLKSYDDVENNVGLISNKLNLEQLFNYYFKNCDVQPDAEDLDLILQYIDDMGAMPPFFTFEMRDAFDPKKISDKVNAMFEKVEDKEMWLKELYDKSAVLQQIYRYFYAFKKTVFDAMKVKSEAEIHTVDDRETYSLVENYFDLHELFEELKLQYPKLITDGLVKLAWSDNVVLDWFALCERFNEQDGYEYEIHINKILSSPQIDRELIKYLIFHELLHQNGYWGHNIDFRLREWQFPNSEEHDGVLDRLAIEYNMEEYYKNAVKYETHERNKEVIVNADLEEEEKEIRPKGIQEGFKYCRNCGNKLPDSAKFCDKCGEKLDY